MPFETTHFCHPSQGAGSGNDERRKREQEMAVCLFRGEPISPAAYRRTLEKMRRERAHRHASATVIQRHYRGACARENYTGLRIRRQVGRSVAVPAMSAIRKTFTRVSSFYFLLSVPTNTPCSRSELLDINVTEVEEAQKPPSPRWIILSTFPPSFVAG